jgi:transposase
LNAFEYGILGSMEDRTALELLNSLRTTVFASNGRRDLLDGLDLIESLLREQERQRTVYHSQLAERDQKIAEQVQKMAELDTRTRIAEEKLSLLEEQIRLDNARKFGRSSERWTPDETMQAQLFNELEVAVACDAMATSEEAGEPEALRQRKDRNERRERVGGGRKPLPANFPRREIVLDLPESEKVCSSCGKIFVRIGEDVSERLCIEPMKFFVEKTIRPTYGCSCGCGGMHGSPAPERIIPKSIASPSFLSQIIASKFCDALPFYRQANILERDGIEVSRATMARWALEAHLLLSPLTELIRKKIRTSAVMGMDETRVRVLHENGETKEGLSWMWCAAAAIELPEPAGSNRELKLITYYYAGGRDKEVAQELLTGFTGILMSDAYAAYNEPSRSVGIVQAACMAHVRRKFYDVLKIEKGNKLANEALGYIKALYDVERAYADKPHDERLVARQGKSLPIMKSFWEWLVANGGRVRPGSTLGKAISYTIPLWPRLEVFLGDGRVPIDNNIIENAIRPFTVGRRNWLFFDQSHGAEASTSFYTIIETAKANGIEPMHFLKFLFNCIERFGQDNMPWEQLLPTPAIRTFADSAGIPYDMV